MSTTSPSSIIKGNVLRSDRVRNNNENVECDGWKGKWGGTDDIQKCQLLSGTDARTKKIYMNWNSNNP